MKDIEKDSDKLQHHVIFCARTRTSYNPDGNDGSQAELETVQFIIDNLKVHMVEDYRILVNYNIPMIGADAREVDLTVINRYGVFLLEVKSWIGNIEAFDGFWEINKQYKRENPLESINAKARILYARMFGERGELSELKQTSVTGLVVLTRGTDRFTNQSKSDNKAVVGLNNTLIEALSSRLLLHRGAHSHLLDNLDIRRITETIYHKGTRQQEKHVGNYRILKELPPGDLFDAYEAQNVDDPSQHVRLKRYRLPNLSYPDAATAILQFRRSGEALTALGSHTNILGTKNFFRDLERPDMYYEVTELVPGKDRRLDEIMARSSKPFSLQEQLHYLEQLCLALRHAHRYETPAGKTTPIYHRNIRPETIFVTNGQVVKLADFDFAKFSDKHTISVEKQALVEGDFIAPEVLNKSSDATPASDIYALGVLWYKLASMRTHAPKFDSKQAIKQIERLLLPKVAQDLMKRMIAPAPIDRPHNVDEVLIALQQIKEDH
jgi:hypothetical protein